MVGRCSSCNPITPQVVTGTGTGNDSHGESGVIQNEPDPNNLRPATVELSVAERLSSLDLSDRSVGFESTAEVVGIEAIQSQGSTGIVSPLPHLTVYPDLLIGIQFV